MENMFTKNLTRRTLLRGSVVTTISVVALNVIPAFVLAGQQGSGIEHPIKKPKQYTDKGRCPNCGMMLNMWARTRHEFSNSEGVHSTCSIRCMADMVQNSGEKAAHVKTALYLHPETMVDAATASYVVGSSAKGTMTMKSKLAFASSSDATEFAKLHGGKVVPFTTALMAATKELSMSRPKIEQKRKKKGKIAEPAPDTRCAVCGMYPARYPENKCQLSTAKGETHHFCSSHCLVSFIAEPKQFIETTAKIKSVWVTIPEEQSYEYAMGLYYVVGSNIMGPMGKEAVPYRNKVMANTVAGKQGGQVVRFKELTPLLLNGK